MLEQEATGVPDSTVPIWLSIHYPPNMAKAARPFPFPAPFNYLAPSKPLVAPSNVLPQSKVGFSLHLRPPTSRSWSLPIPRGLTADDPPPRARHRWCRPVPPAHAHGGISRHAPTRPPPPHTWLVTSPGRPRISILRRLRNWRSVCSRRFRISSGSSGGSSSSGTRRSAASPASTSAPASGLSGGR